MNGRIVLVIVGVVALIVAGAVWLYQGGQRIFFTPTETRVSEGTTEEAAIEVVAENLDIPWEITWLPGGDMLVTERSGQLLRIAEDRSVIPIQGVAHVGEGGLLGVVVHPDFDQNQFIYVYITTRSGTGLINRVERYRLSGNSLSDRTVILADIPGSSFHDGGELAFGPEGLLYITTGDAGDKPLAQDTNSLAGKILRLHDDGQVPADNPFGNAVYSLGHRNPQGLAWDEDGQLWATEHGQSHFDEVNIIEAGANYGWPVIEGNQQRSDMKSPIIQSGAEETWAPAGIAAVTGRIFFGGLRGESLFVAERQGRTLSGLTAHVRREFGRIRAVAIGPDGLLYVGTSNQDGRGSVQPGDDKIIRIDPASL